MKPAQGSYKWLTPERRAELLHLFAEGVSYKALAEQFNIDEAAVGYHARKHGLTGKRPMGRPNEYADNATSFRCGVCCQTLPAAAFGKRRDFTRGGNRPVFWRCKVCDITCAAASRYKLAVEQARQLLQQPLCDICVQPQHSRRNGKLRHMFIDHDHVTGRLRGALCERCNSGLGLAQDSIDRLTALQAYLQRTPLVLPEPITVQPKLQWMRHIERTYQLTVSQYQHLVEKQAGLCAVCTTFVPTTKFPRLLVDHCHGGGQVRGLLCYECNLAIGKFDNDVALVESAKAYLVQHT